MDLISRTTRHGKELRRLGVKCAEIIRSHFRVWSGTSVQPRAPILRAASNWSLTSKPNCSRGCLSLLVRVYIASIIVAP
ncbi:hypothetical protein RHGRI_025990 [Rhododendron griersonianum]|uniref:Uncharacterized protein n=1 Tax=Rhododendron griersonianum TaxID=479676 RepID=A0AAV6IR94_9ERIC|nr:hypothetical protein RHGRI_025990 [Rhododendron griersonianum]